VYDVGYVLALAFSGSDLTRALWFGLIGSLLCSAQMPPFKMALIVVLLDRAWPYLGMGFAGYGAQEIAASIAYGFRTLGSDALIVLIRAVGLYALVTCGYWLRLMLHGHKPGSGSGRMPLPF
jgi:hypothetical protein